ncbi:SDR family oxidoreductase [Garciella nitratireducens]|uniref:SDR family oxidoreductase n=1 Tax=Garciella nitratireducens TaxID=218205 RepID=UPI003B58F570
MVADQQWMNFPKSVLGQTQQKQPGVESMMNPIPITENPKYKGSNQLQDKVAVITGGDSGIGKAVAIAFAKEGANIVIVYLDEHEDAKNTKNMIESIGKKCLLIAGDVGHNGFCKEVIQKVIQQFGKIDILINNVAEQHSQNRIEDITNQQLENTFRTNVFSMFYMIKAAMPYLRQGSCIINTASITAYQGNEILIDYSASKGAVISFTRSLSQSLASQGIRVNAVAPGPIWTPLIPASFSADHVATFGSDTPMGRPGQPVELASAYVYLASEGASYVTGQTIHVNGGTIVNG